MSEPTSLVLQLVFLGRLHPDLDLSGHCHFVLLESLHSDCRSLFHVLPEYGPLQHAQVSGL